MSKLFIFIGGSLLWFLLSGIFIAERVGIESWIASSALYSLGFYWIFPYTFSKTMYFPHSSEPIIEQEENNEKRTFLFILGLLFSSLVSII
jgi:hypothetical protein